MADDKLMQLRDQRRKELQQAVSAPPSISAAADPSVLAIVKRPAEEVQSIAGRKRARLPDSTLSGASTALRANSNSLPSNTIEAPVVDAATSELRERDETATAGPAALSLSFDRFSVESQPQHLRTRSVLKDRFAFPEAVVKVYEEHVGRRVQNPPGLCFVSLIWQLFDVWRIEMDLLGYLKCTTSSSFGFDHAAYALGGDVALRMANAVFVTTICTTRPQSGV